MIRKQKAISNYYIVVLSLILALAISTHLLIEQVTMEQEGAAAVINIAGRQRMLSQRVTLFAGEFLRTGRESDRKELEAAIRLMEQQHQTLTQPEPDSTFEARLTPPLQDLYLRQGLAQQVEGFLSAANRIANGTAQDEQQTLDYLLSLASHSMLDRLDLAVRLYQTDSEQAVESLRRVQLGTSAILLLSILAEAVLIFRPLLNWSHRMHELAMTDELTGVANRRSFVAAATERLADRRNQTADTAFLMLDVDDFKAVNDDYGHEAGDIVLQAIGEALRLEARQHDLVGRMGGEEFCVMLPNISATQAESVGQRILDRVASTSIRTSPLTKLTVTLSGGLTLAERGEALQDVLRRADELLYRAKRSGKAHVEQDCIGEVA